MVPGGDRSALEAAPYMAERKTELVSVIRSQVLC